MLYFSFSLVTFAVLYLLVNAYIFKNYRNVLLKQLGFNLILFIINIILTVTIIPTQFFVLNVSLINIPECFVSYLACFILIDFCFYILHRLEHSLSFLWKIHRIHHQSIIYNGSVALRFSPYYLLYNRIFLLIPCLLGFSVKTVLLTNSIHGLFIFFHHFSFFRLKKLNDIIIFSDFHEIHHNSKIENQHSNLGGVFKIWDQIFKTQCNLNTHTFGVTEIEKNEFDYFFVFFGIKK